MPLPLEIMLPRLNTTLLLENNHSSLKRSGDIDGRRVDGRMFMRLQFVHECRVHELIELKF